MREPLRDRERLEHILSAIDILLANKDRHTLDEVVADPIIFYGYVKQVEIIGEAVYKLTSKFREEHPEVNWDDIEDLTDDTYKEPESNKLQCPLCNGIDYAIHFKKVTSNEEE